MYLDKEVLAQPLDMQQDTYLYGTISNHIKPPEGNSTGVVTVYVSWLLSPDLDF